MALVDLPPGQHATRVRNHWWWRPGWRVGRRFYAFHVTFENQPELYRLADSYRSALSAAPALTLIPDRWLHLTMQGIGFTDEVADETLAAIVDEARGQFAHLSPIDVQFSEVVVADEAIVMPATPAAAVNRLRTTTRAALGQVLGDANVPEDPHRFRPHVSVAYLTTDGPAKPYLRAVAATEPAPATIRVAHVEVIEMHRDREMYEWSLVARLPLQGSARNHSSVIPPKTAS
ncbi:2'-5' RNA ligase family protein [Micromonospora rifamycinica]|uniref:2'-5' RNA ligase family protein n=1 Tax=Micromonospora rifamycinica TaxID=291594 RepID=UPI002E2BB65C|nr:2'-5' RNA ligase family protein [Micromonospora rifamycinica]